MEVEVAKRIFAQSIANRNICYISHYGDGDSKGYEAVKFIYDTEKPVQKFECIGHCQKTGWLSTAKIKNGHQGIK